MRRRQAPLGAAIVGLFVMSLVVLVTRHPDTSVTIAASRPDRVVESVDVTTTTTVETTTTSTTVPVSATTPPPPSTTVARRAVPVAPTTTSPPTTARPHRPVATTIAFNVTAGPPSAGPEGQEYVVSGGHCLGEKPMLQIKMIDVDGAILDRAFGPPAVDGSWSFVLLRNAGYELRQFTFTARCSPVGTPGFEYASQLVTGR
jgi:hypothetical protein